MADQVEMETREEPKFVQFGDGDTHEGVLTQIESITINEKPCVRYTLVRGDGSYISFVGTWQLNRKLRRDDRGHYVKITCTGTDETVKRGDNAMKTFEVKVSKNKVDSDLLVITADDIPF